MIKRLVFNVFLITSLLFHISCLKKEVKFDNPIFSNFFNELNSKNVNDFMKSYYKEKPDYVFDQYKIALDQLKVSKSQIIIVAYSRYQGKKLNIEGDTKNIYIITNGKEVITTVKIEDNRIKYLLPIHKSNELIGWL